MRREVREDRADNVTLGTLSSKFPCPVCGEEKAMRLSKKKKPYLVCNGCGVQMFVRGREGIAKLEELLQRGLVADVEPVREGDGIEP